MNSVRRMQKVLVALALICALGAMYFFVRAGKTRAEAEELKAEGVEMRAEAEKQKAIEAKGVKPAPE